MLELEKINEVLMQTLSERRYQHSLGVAEMAEKLAAKYGADKEKAFLAGLIHDCAKEIPPEEAVTMLRESFHITPDAMSLQAPRLLHGVLGACIAQSRFGIYEPEILDAVRYHTTGKAKMNLLSKIIYIADYIEPNRAYRDVEYLRDLTFQNLEEAMLFAVDFTVRDLVEKGKTIHPDTIHLRNDLLVQKEVLSTDGKGLV